jgi:hypothetical protein
MDLIGGLLQSFGSLFENSKKFVDFIDKKTLGKMVFVLLSSVPMVPKSDILPF